MRTPRPTSPAFSQSLESRTVSWWITIRSDGSAMRTASTSPAREFDTWNCLSSRMTVDLSPAARVVLGSSWKKGFTLRLLHVGKVSRAVCLCQRPPRCHPPEPVYRFCRSCASTPRDQICSGFPVGMTEGNSPWTLDLWDAKVPFLFAHYVLRRYMLTCDAGAVKAPFAAPGPSQNVSVRYMHLEFRILFRRGLACAPSVQRCDSHKTGDEWVFSGASPIETGQLGMRLDCTGTVTWPLSAGSVRNGWRHGRVLSGVRQVGQPHLPISTRLTRTTEPQTGHAWSQALRWRTRIVEGSQGVEGERTSGPCHRAGSLAVRGPAVILSSSGLL